MEEFWEIRHNHTCIRSGEQLLLHGSGLFNISIPTLCNIIEDSLTP